MGVRIAIRGRGAVSPAGWGAEALAEAFTRGSELPASEITREGNPLPASGRSVPDPDPLPSCFREPRLRRTSSVGRFGVAAALEALGDRREDLETGTLRAGIVFCGTNGIVEYSRRFYTQVLEDPAFASPILFPETVYNAPSSHLSALLGSHEINYTLLGDSSGFVAGIDLAAQWLKSGRVAACLVVAAEELDWLSAEAFHLFEPGPPVAEGAAALLLEAADSLAPGDIELVQTTDPVLYSPLFSHGGSFASKRLAVGKMLRREIEASGVGSGTVLVDGKLGAANLDATEDAVWADWNGERFSPLLATGAAFSVNSGWQSVIAAHLLSERGKPGAIVSALGGTQQAAAAVFRRV